MNSRGERRGLTIAIAVVVVAIAVVAALLVAMPSTHMVTVDVDGAGTVEGATGQSYEYDGVTYWACETTGDERRMYEVGYVFESFEGKEPYSIDRVV